MEASSELQKVKVQAGAHPVGNVASRAAPTCQAVAGQLGK